MTLSDAEILLGVIDFVEEENRDKLGIGIQLYIEVPEEVNIDDMYTEVVNQGYNIAKHIENREWGERAFVI